MRIAVIPARGGSKRIPRKNIRDFCGKPMIAWSIAAAKASELFDRIIVSTDDAEIIEVAQQWGAETPFIRPAELADDHAGTTEVIAHATQWALNQEWPINAVCCIYATAPFVQVEDLQQSLAIMESSPWAYVFTATDFAAPIFRSFRQHPEGGIEMFFPEHFTTRSQDLPIALHDAGQFYWGRPEAWLSNQRVFERHSFPLLIPRWRVQDIDTEEDWQRAELIHQALFAGVTL
ncbi:MAG: pseudaminic acid cytidylyltransferase [Candidatus Competibacteraceae bacterium]|nr:pseudaminic acid cytidylyltransferase [Candidatus Competibacteraceae bacterium]